MSLPAVPVREASFAGAFHGRVIEAENLVVQAGSRGCGFIRLARMVEASERHAPERFGFIDSIKRLGLLAWRWRRLQARLLWCVQVLRRLLGVDEGQRAR